MNISVAEIILVFIVVMIHEFGHWIAFLWINKKAEKLHIHWWGFTVGESNTIQNMSIRNALLVYLWGIQFGLIYLIATIYFIHIPDWWFIVYFGLSIIDILFVLSVYYSMKNYKISIDKLVKDIPCTRCENYVEIEKVLIKRGDENDEK